MQQHVDMNSAIGFDWDIRNFGRYEAVVCGDRTFTNIALRDYASRLAAALHALGVQPGATIATQLDSSPEFAIVLEATLRGGFVVAPLSASTPQALRQRLLEHCDAAALIASSRVFEGDMSIDVTRRTCIAVSPDTRLRMRVPDFWDVIARHAPLSGLVTRKATDAAIIHYSSGTTATPKGVIRTHGDLTHGDLGSRIAAGRGYAGLKYRGGQWAAARRDALVGRVRGRIEIQTAALPTILLALPLSHRYGCDHLLARIFSRTRIALLDRFDPHAVLSAVERYRVRALPLVPSFAEALLSISASFSRYDLSSLQRVYVSGSQSRAGLLKTLQAQLGVRVDNVYGMTEGGGTSTARSLKPKPGSVGAPFPGNQLRIVSDGGDVLTDGKVGEVEIQTPSPFAGYLGDTKASVAVRDGAWRRTGDIGYLDADGDLFVVGRLDNLIVQGGTKIASEEVESELHAVPGIREAAVVGLQDAFLGERMVACVVLEPGVTLTADAVIAECRKVLDANKTPVAVRFIDGLPKSDLGKLRRHELRQLLQAELDETRETAFTARLRALPNHRQRGCIRQALVDHIGRIIGDTTPDAVPSINTTTPLLEQGLSSLDLVRLTSAMTELLGRRVDVTSAFNYATIDKLSDFLTDTQFGMPSRAPDATEGHSSTANASSDMLADVLLGNQPRSRAGHEGRRTPSDAVAIIGIGCRFPGGANDPSAFWTLLCQAIDASTEIPRQDARIPECGQDAHRAAATYPRRAALLVDGDRFDAESFALSERDAVTLSRSDRIVLDVAREAVEHAGLGRDALAAIRSGVYIGTMGGGAKTAGLVSHFLDLCGPSLVVDTACSSSLVAIHMAAEALRRQECDLALCGGVQMLELHSVVTGAGERGLLAADGRCKAFDAAADGIGLGEGCGFVVLTRIEDAAANDDRIIAAIRGSAVNHDGRSAMVTAPNGLAQQKLIQAAVRAAAIEPPAIDYLEAHGSGTELGDAIEARAAVDAMGATRERPLVVGSVKTNIGHTLGAAGIASLIKAALCVDKALIPPNLHFQSLNPLLAPIADALEIPTTVRQWPETAGRPRIAAVTSIGLYGTNAHVIVEQAPSR